MEAWELGYGTSRFAHKSTCNLQCMPWTPVRHSSGNAWRSYSPPLAFAVHVGAARRVLSRKTVSVHNSPWQNRESVTVMDRRSFIIFLATSWIRSCCSCYFIFTSCPVRCLISRLLIIFCHSLTRVSVCQFVFVKRWNLLFFSKFWWNFDKFLDSTVCV